MEKTTFGKEIFDSVPPLDKSEIFEIRTYSDGKSGSILQYHWIYSAKPMVYIAQTFLHTATGRQVDLKVPLKAETLSEAIEEFPAAILAGKREVESRMHHQAIMNGEVKPQ